MAHGSLDQTLESSDDHRRRGPSSSSSSSSASRLNARAAEFVPRNANHHGHGHHHHHNYHPHQRGVAVAPAPMPVHVFQPPPSPPSSHFHVGSPQYYVGLEEQEAAATPDHESGPAREGLADEVVQKVVNQVEYYFSDVNLATTDHLMRFINKDPEGFVPMSVVAAFKKIKSLVNSHTLLADALRTSSKLVVSDDGKKVRRQQPFTDEDVEELQSRIVVAENLPEEHSHQKLMKIFSSIGSVKSIRTCPAQPVNGATPAASRSGKMDMFFSHKLHAFVEYETVELAEKAVAELNDERNWRSGLRVRLLLKCMSKPARGRRGGHDGDWNGDEEDASTVEQSNDKQLQDDFQGLEILVDHTGDENFNEREVGGRRGGRGRGRGKSRGRGQHHNNRGGSSHAIGTPPSSGNHIQNDQPKQPPPGPRMPDGTRGFTAGRGKPLSSATTTAATTTSPT